MREVTDAVEDVPAADGEGPEGVAAASGLRACIFFSQGAER